MSSDDVSQSSVAVRASAPSSSETLSGPAKLCESCQNAHGPLLNDKGSHWSIDWDRSGSLYLSGGERRSVMLLEDEWPDLPRLTASKAGCLFCPFILETLRSKRFIDAYEYSSKGSSACTGQKSVRLDIHYESHTSLSSWPFSGYDKEMFLVVKAIFDGGFVVNMHFEVAADADSPAVAKYLNLKAPGIRHYEHEGIASFIAGQLSSVPLNVNSDDPNACFIPARLIDVRLGNLQLAEEDEVRAGSKKQPEYCALSYCWGPPEDAKSQVKTTKMTRRQNLASIRFDDLPQVLQDAVTTTRALDIPYLWVDALCILQGDEIDWEIQCSQMNKIYGNARVTLIAASSRTCKEGFLKPRRPALRFPYQSARHDEIEGSFMMYFTHASGNTIPSNCFIGLHNDLHRSHWGRRGWTFQEHAMAKAHIVFGTSGVYFGLDEKYVAKGGEAGPTYPQAPVTSLQTNQELHRAWEKILLRYSACKESSFTEIKDLLPALSGLAREFGIKFQFDNSLPVKYIAGHWVDRLHYTLLWQNDPGAEAPSLDEIKTRHIQEKYLVPTWSCLTRNAGELKFLNSEHNLIHGQHRDFRSEIKILDIRAPLAGAGSDPYGAIESASMTLEGFVLDLKSLLWFESPDKLVGYLESQTEIWLGNPDDSFPLSTDEFYIFDRTGQPPRADTEHAQYEAGEMERLALKDFDLGPTYDSCFGGSNSCGFGPYSGSRPRSAYRHETLHSYHMEREYQSKQDIFAKPGKMRASFDELISRVVLLLVASEKKPENMAIQESDGYGLMLIRLDGAKENSFLRVGMFRPLSHSGGLPCLKRLMKRETIVLL